MLKGFKYYFIQNNVANVLREKENKKFERRPLKYHLYYREILTSKDVASTKAINDINSQKNIQKNLLRPFPRRSYMGNST